MQNKILAILCAVMTGACGEAGVEADAQEAAAAANPVEIAAAYVTDPVEEGGIVNAAFWSDPSAPGQSLVLGAAGSGGLEFYFPDGARAGKFGGIDAGFVTVLDNVIIDGHSAPLVVIYDATSFALDAYLLDRDSLQLRRVMQKPVPIGDEVVGLCRYTSPLSGSHYVFAATDGGMTFQFELFAGSNGVDWQLTRSVPTGKDTAFCAVDDADSMLYIAEEAMGIWRLGAEPESDTVRQPVDLSAPWGGLSDDIKGIGIYPAGDHSWLIVADVGESRLALYRLPDVEALGNVTVTGLSEAEGVSATNSAPGDGYPHGLVAIADEDESDGGTDIKLVAWQSFAEALNLGTPASGAARSMEAPKVVKPVADTEPVDNYGDAADDPAIWIHPTDAEQSLVIGTDKKLGLYVYDLDGKKVQSLPDGKMNNVDLRDDFPLDGQLVTLVTASNRSTDSIAVYRMDAAARQLVETADGILPTGFLDPYGLCMYRSAASGEFYVFVNEGDEGTFRQWRLFDNGNGKVAAERVREFPVVSQTEGCVADDELGHLYVGEEDRGIWKYPAEPDGGGEGVLIDSTGDDGRLTADVEGIALWAGRNGSGYIVVSNQGADNYAVYRREDDNEYVGHFHVVANAGLGIDGASETDGLAVTSAVLGERYPSGLLVVQDGRNIAPEDRQNFKYVSWQDVEKVLGL